MQTRSMVYTEYFLAREAAGGRLRPARATRGIFDRVAGIFGKERGAGLGRRAAQARLPPEAAAPTTGAVTGGAVPDEQKVERRRGTAEEEARVLVDASSAAVDKDKDEQRDKDQDRDRERQP